MSKWSTLGLGSASALLLVTLLAVPARADDTVDVDAVTFEVIPAFETDYPIGVGVLSRSSSGAIDQDSADDPASGATVASTDSDVQVIIARAGVQVAAQVAASWYCSVYADDPRHALDDQGYQIIEGYGFQSCTGVGWQLQRYKIQVQQYRGWGHWATKTSWPSEWTNTSFVSRTQWWRCASGTGKQTYRIVSTGWAEGGRYGLSVQSENYLRVTCPL
jgi:hypothetical protein